MTSRPGALRWWIVAAALVVPRAIAWPLPLVDMHSVRETQTAMITRNLLVDNFAMGQTRIDWNGNGPSVVVQELPIYQAMVAAVWWFAGASDAAGRVLSTAAAAAAAFGLWLLLSRLCGPSAAFWGVLWFALCPISIWAGTAFLPNMLAMAFVLLGLAAVVESRTRRTIVTGLGGGALITIAWLMNEPLVAAFGGPLVWAFWPRRDQPRRDLWVKALVIGCGLVATVLWGRHVVRTNAASYSEWNLPTLLAHFFAPETSRLSPWLWFRSAAYLLFFVVGPAGVLWIIGGIRSLARPSRPSDDVMRLAVCWGASVVAYYLVFLRALSEHNYYTLPVVPFLSLLFAVFAKEIVERWREYGRWSRALVTAAAIASLAWWPLPIVHSMTVDTTAYEAGRLVERSCPAGEMILVAPLHTNVASEVYPTVLYYAGRRGWNVGTGRWSPESLMTQIGDGAGRGARCLVVSFGRAFEPSVLQKIPGFHLFGHDVDQQQVPALLTALGTRYEVLGAEPNVRVFSLRP